MSKSRSVGRRFGVSRWLARGGGARPAPVARFETLEELEPRTLLSATLGLSTAVTQDCT